MSAVLVGVVGLVDGCEVVVIALGHDFVLQQVAGAVQLQVGARSFDLGLRIVCAGLLEVGALQHADDLTLGDLLTGQNLQCEHAAADGRIDVDDGGGIGLNAPGEGELILHRLGVRHDRVEDAILRSRCVRGISGLMAFAASREQQGRGKDKGRAELDGSHGRISVAAAKLIWCRLSHTCMFALRAARLTCR